MTALLILFFLQSLIAFIVIVVLKGILIRDLQQASIEKFSSLIIPEGINQITVYYAKDLSSVTQDEIKRLVHRKSPVSKVDFQQLESLKGGLMIKIADEVLDFSLSSRLEHLWS